MEMMKDLPARFINFPESLHDQRTYIIFGMVRSGTSMMAGLLWRIGIDVGNYELLFIFISSWSHEII